MTPPTYVRLWRSENFHTIIKMAADARRKIMTLDDRVDVLKRIGNGESCRSIAAAVNCGKSQISRIRSSEGMGEWRQIRPEICETP